jgi:dienelactone hydrolase
MLSLPTMRRSLVSSALLAFSVLALAACAGGSSTTSGPDNGGSSGDAPDAGGRGSNDAGGGGTGTSNDDAGAATDAANTDSSSTPLRADVPSISCNDAVDDVYTTPSGLPSFSPTARGDVIRCAHDSDLPVAAVQGQLTGAGISTPATSGTTLYRIAFRTTRGNGAAGDSSARVYLPTNPRALPLPVIVVAHPTEGLASSCAPSKDPTSLQDLALPWAALGFAVIAPDYAGLGNDDVVQGYVDNHDTGFSTLDAARALRKLMAKGVLSDSVLAVGWSQGGGAVLSAQALAKSYGADGNLVGVIAFAPEWPTRPNSFGYVDMLKSPAETTIQTGVSEPVVAVTREYAYFKQYLGAAHATDAFPSSARSGIDGAITSMCQTPFGGYLQGTCPTVGQLFDDSFRTSLLACIGGDTANCNEPAKGWYAFMQSNVLTADASGAPILFVQGIADTIMPAASEAACNIEKLKADGVTPQVCTDLIAVHTDVVPRNMDYALTWGQAVVAGGALPACPSTFGMPPCTP